MGVAIADVAGHGVGAALYMAAAKGALHAEARRVLSPGDLLRRANEALVADFRAQDVFATAFFARFIPAAAHSPTPTGDTIRRCSCGADGRDRPAARRRDRPWASCRIETTRRSAASFAAGDLLSLYTDGLVEARNAGAPVLRHGAADRAGPAQPGRAMRERSGERSLEDLFRHCAAGTLQDDVTLVVIERWPHRSRSPRRARGMSEMETARRARCSSSTTTRSSAVRSSSSCARRASCRRRRATATTACAR